MKGGRRCALFVLSLFFCSSLFCQPPEDSAFAFTFTATDIEQLRQVFVSILTNTEASEEDLKTVNNFFNESLLAINQLPKKQEEALKLSEENTQLKKENDRIRFIVPVLSTISAASLAALIVAIITR